MLSKEEFVTRILDGKAAGTVHPTTPEPARDALAGFDTFDPPDDQKGSSDNTRFAQLLLEQSGFGTGETLPRDEVVLGTQKTSRFLPLGATYWPKTTDRPFHILLFELELPGSAILQHGFFRQSDHLEDALHRIVQDVLEGFERGGFGRRADVRQGPQHETLCVVSVLDDRYGDTAQQLVCFGTKSVETNSLEVFTLREEARDWAARGDRALAEEHLGQLYERHFQPLAKGANWQTAFVSGPERKKASALLEAARTVGRDEATEDRLRGAVHELLDEIARSFGVRRRREGRKHFLEMVDLPPNHAIGVDPDASWRRGFENPLRGVRIYDGSERLLGFIVYFPNGTADLDRLRESLRAHNHFHNVLVVHPDADEPELELWQGAEPLRGRLLSGSRRSRFDGEGGVVQLLSRFFVVSKSEISRPSELATELAWRARHLRSLALQELANEEKAGGGPLKQLHDVFSQALATLSKDEFADTYAQTITYGMLAARWLSADRERRLFTRTNVSEFLPATSAFLKELFEQLVNSRFDRNLTWLLDDITSLLARTSVIQVFEGERDPSIHFYQDFLDAYDPQIRRDMGVYYTPDEVVEYMVQACDRALREEIGVPLGLADPMTWSEWSDTVGRPVPANTDADAFVVQVLDPSVGTGTFLVHVLDVIFETMRAQYEGQGMQEYEAAEAWKQYVRTSLLPRLNAFELMMAPYIVSHLRVGLALERGLAESRGLDARTWGFHFGPGDRVRVFLTDTLELDSSAQLRVLGPEIAEESKEAERIKCDTAISVIVGNPPYDRVTRDLQGDQPRWIISGQVPGRSSGGSLFDDLLDVAREHTVFSHHASLYNLYVYFWRWALWRVLERDPTAPGVVCLITANSWLTGPGFVGLRKLMREAADQIWTVDLGGDNRGALRDANVFGIETPVGITRVVRSADDEGGVPARCSYRLVRGDSVQDKLTSLRQVPLNGADPQVGWETASPGILDPLVPPTGDATWSSMPRLIDVFPWQQPGCKFGRLWPISPSPDSLRERWERFVASPVTERPVLFQTGTSGRNINTKVGGLDKLVSMRPGSPHQPIRRYGYRSFDRQWVFDDPRMAKTESPSLWATQSPKQVFLATMVSKRLGPGPAMTASAYVRP